MDDRTERAPWNAIDDDARATLFTRARTPNSFSPQPVSDAELTAIWELARWAPTSANIQPLRVTWVRSPEARARLVPLMLESNQGKVQSAPAVAVLAADLDFHETIPRTFPSRPQLKDNFADPERRHQAARYNATLQAAYFIMAVRAVGLAAGPMLGFDGPGIDAELFAGTPLTTVLVVNVGHPGANPWFPRLPRLDHDEVVRWI